MERYKRYPARRIKKGTLYACVGLYKFKGVKNPYQIYAIGIETKSLQPPPASEKVKRLGGPKYIKKKARSRTILEWTSYIYKKIALLTILGLLYFLISILMNPNHRWILGLPKKIPLLDQLSNYF
jgi:hypothetical protein